MQIGHLELFARDPKATADFYLDKLGFQPVVTQPGNLHWIALKDQEILVRPAGRSIDEPATYGESSIAIVLYTDGLEATTARLESVGVETVSSHGPGSVTFRDPDGRWIQLVDPAKLT
jgi:catechol 2,3-dioxygenase-like lactoylglutathione lyase family enzyme